MFDIPILEVMLAPLARRERWDFELWMEDGRKPFAKRDLHEVKPEFHDIPVGESREVSPGVYLKRV